MKMWDGGIVGEKGEGVNGEEKGKAGFGAFCWWGFFSKGGKRGRRMVGRGKGGSGKEFQLKN